MRGLAQRLVLRARGRAPLLVWFLVAAVLLRATLAWARPGGGGSFSGGGGGGGGDDDFFGLILWIVFELCIEHPQVGLPLLGAIIILWLAARAKSTAGKVIAGVVGVAYVGGLFLLMPGVMLGIVGAVVLAVIVWVISNAVRKRPAEWHTGAHDPLTATTAATARRELLALREADPDFSIVLFEDFVYALFAELHRAGAQAQAQAQAQGGSAALERWRPYLDPAAREALIPARTPRARIVEVRDVIVAGMELMAVERSDERVQVTVRFEANFTEVPEAGEPAGVYQRERWRLVRRAGARSRPPERVRVFGCPNCGAPLDGIAGSTCSHCKEVVDTGRFDWRVEAIEIIHRSPIGPVLTADVPERGTALPTVLDPGLAPSLAALHARDPEFDEEALRRRVDLIFNNLQVAWSERDWTRARPFLSDTLFQSQLYWIEAYRKAGLRNRTDGARLTRIELVRVTSDRWYDAVTVRLHGTGTDYTVDDTGRVVAGAKGRERPYTEYWTLLRGAERKGPAGVEPRCPNCGAELKINMTGNCEFCRARVTSGAFDWVLSRIEQDEVYAG